jgi:pyridinium-3,5-bisthiocarboxylic acid mononucleotide nickel chelatase
MRVAYLDCFAGISGDMLLGALIGAGVPVEVLREAVAALDLGASLKVETVDRSGISCTKVSVFEGASPAEGAVRDQVEAHSHEPVLQQQAHKDLAYTQEPKTRHLHKTGHAHTHEEPQVHSHGRSLSAIRTLIRTAKLAEPVKAWAVRAFELLGDAEARVHNVPVEEIHFHEVGAVDAIVDMVAASAGIHHLQIGAWYCSPVNVGGGMVQCAHGTFPVPAPATADLLRGVPTYSAHVQKELATPTGAALLRTLDPTFGPQPAMKVEQIGYGAGTRNTEGFPNVLRLSIGEAADGVSAVQTVTVIETALDDLSPQVLAHVTEAALANGALDVMLTPVIMKKGRPGTLLTVLCNERDRLALEHLILSETSTLGVRIRQDQRVCLNRGHTTVQTEYGAIRIKTGSRLGEEFNAAPEFEDCKAAALSHKVPVKQVQQAAIAAYRR